MPWQKVVGIDREEGSLILENSDGEQYEASVFTQIEELQENHEVHVLVEQFPKWKPARLKAWYTDSPDNDA